MKAPKYAREVCITGLATLAIGSLLLAALPAVAQASEPAEMKIDAPSAHSERMAAPRICGALDAPHA